MSIVCVNGGGYGSSLPVMFSGSILKDDRGTVVGAGRVQPGQELGIAHGVVVKKHGGTISVESEVGLSGYGCMAACAAGSLCASWIADGDLPDYANQLSLARYNDGNLMAEIMNSPSKGIL